MFERDRATGRVVKEFHIPTNPEFLRTLRNGHYLVGGARSDAHREIDAAGAEVAKRYLPMSARLTWVDGDAILLRDGSLIVLGEDRISEVTREGKVVWERFTLKPGFMVRECLGLVRLGFDATRPPEYDLQNDVPYHILMLNNPHGFVQVPMLKDFKRMGSSALRAFPRIMDLAISADEPVRHAALDTLEGLGRRAAPYLVAAASDKRPKVRATAINILGTHHTPSPDIIRVVLEARNDKDPYVRSEAISALRILNRKE